MSYKKDIHHLTAGELEDYSARLMALPLATYRDRQTADRVDLYSYVSMAVAALKVQGMEIDELTKQVAGLRAEIKVGSRRKQ